MLSNTLHLFKRYNYNHKKFEDNVKKLSKLVQSCKINENTDIFI